MHVEVVILKYKAEVGEGRHRFIKKNIELELSASFIHTYTHMHTNINGFKKYQNASEAVRVGMFYKTCISRKYMITECWSQMFECRHFR